MTTLKEQIDNITDTFTGADGGLKFVMFLKNMREIETRDDPASKEILELVRKFSKLLDALDDGFDFFNR
jgi:hypothetical protein